jgi:hypothetical protein
VTDYHAAVPGVWCRTGTFHEGRRLSEVADEFERVYNIGRSVPSGFFKEQDSTCSLSF